MKHLDLFSGIGGFALAARWVGWETIGFCEIDPYCQKVLRKHWPDVPIHEDIRELDGTQYRGSIGIITGGFPCQPFSHAGKRRGKDDDRNLWPEMARVIRETRPNFIVGENTYGIVSMELDNVLSDLEGFGYTAEAIVIPACAVESHQGRQRVWILAHTMQGKRSLGRDAPGGRWEPKQISWNGMGEKKATPRVVGKFDGIPNGLDRIRSLGNAIVPQVAEVIFRAIDEIDRMALKS